MSAIIRPEISTAKNKRAVEVVYEIGRLVVRAGKEGTPNIRIDTLIGRCYELSSVMVEAYDENIRNHKKRNQILRRTFETAWKYLKEYTIIPENYDYEEFIPINTVYSIIQYFSNEWHSPSPFLMEVLILPI